MAQASRRNRRPRVCVCPPETPPVPTVDVTGISGSNGDNFLFMTVDGDVAGSCSPKEGVFHPPELLINGVPSGWNDTGTVASDTFNVNFLDTFNSGDSCVLTIPVGCECFVMKDLTPITPGDYPFLVP